jgi:hypothetical protein
MNIKRFWLVVCLLWALAGGTLLYFIDGSLVGGIVWLLAGVLMGCLGPLFLQRFVEVLPGWGKASRPDFLFIVVPVGGLIYGTLLGPFLGLSVASDAAGQAWLGALLGVVLGPPVLAVPIAVVLSLTPLPRSEPGIPPEPESPRRRRLHRVRVFLMCLALPALTCVVLVRSILWLPRRRKRLRVYTRLTQLGAVFGADPARDKFYGVSLDRVAVEDADLEQLRVFPELDHIDVWCKNVTDRGLASLRSLKGLKILTLSGAEVTDASLVHVAALHELEGLCLARTNVTDYGLALLQDLPRLRYLNVRGTHVTDRGVQQLLETHPHLQVER